MSASSWDTLNGKFFHTLCSGGRVQQQGQIVGALGDGFYVVCFFEWFTGSKTKRQVVHVHDMQRGKWALYESDESMREHYEGAIGVLPHDGKTECPCRREVP